MPSRLRAAALLTALGVAAGTGRASARGMTIDLDARDAARRLLHARLTIPVTPGPQVLLYPEWLPGDHGPTGPIVNLAGLEISAGGKPLAWQRDADSMFAFHVDVPAGVDSLTVKLDYLAPAASGEAANASVTSTLALISWNEVLLYPRGPSLDDLQITAALRLPPGWKAASSLPIARDGGGTIDYAPVSVTELIDSPVLAGAHTRTLSLADKPKVSLFAAADDADLLEPRPEQLEALRRLPLEASALFGGERYKSYVFLLTLADSVSWFGLEHHESSDIRVSERFFVDPDDGRAWEGLLPHEIVHSWNGKYRRPAGLMPGRFDAPMHGELLWVYEGLTEYLGNVLTTRSGLADANEYRDVLAFDAAKMELSRGRAWRSLADVAVAAQTLYVAPDEGDSRRRGIDIYPEGQLVWLEVDTIIRQRTGGKASLDDFCRRFVTGPPGAKVVPYALEDVVAALAAVAPYDWKGFFQERVYKPQQKPPLAGIEAAGWKLVYGETPTPMIEAEENVKDYVEARFSLGFKVTKDGLLPDVVAGSPAAAAGVPPGATLIAVNGRKYSAERLRDAIRDSRRKKSVELIVETGEVISQHTLGYAGGARYPRLERIADRPDLLSAILAPLTSRR